MLKYWILIPCSPLLQRPEVTQMGSSKTPLKPFCISLALSFKCWISVLNWFGLTAVVFWLCCD